MISISNHIRWKSSFSWSSYWATRLDMWFKNRSNAVIEETLKDNDSSIVPSVASFNGSNNFVNFPADTDYDFTGDFYIYIPHFALGTLTGTDTVISKEASPGGAEWRIDISSTGRITLLVFYGGVVGNYWQFQTGTGVIASSGTYWDLLISYQASTKTAFIGINGLTKAHTDTTAGVITSVTQGASPIRIGAIGRAAAVQFFVGKMGLIQCGAEYVTTVASITTNFFKCPLSGIASYEYDVTNGGTGTWSGTSPHIAYHANGSRFAFDNGYKLYEKTGQIDEQVPTGGDVTVIVAAGYTLKSTHVASLLNINKASGLINFNYLGLTAGGYYDIVFDGDSLTLGTGSTAGNTYPEQLAAKFLTDDTIKINITNLGVGSATLADMEADAATQVDVLQADYKRILIVWGGINDLALAPQQTKENTWARMQTYVDNRRAAGWDYIFAMTITPQSAYVRADYEVARAYVNNLIRTSLDVDGVIDLAGDARIGDAGDELDLTYYNADKIHMNNTGYGVVAALAYAVIKATIVANKHVGLASLDMFDKNNSTIHIASGGMDYVDATNYFLWRMDEIITYAKYNSYFNAAYQDMLFTKIEDDLLKEILVCTLQQTGGALTKAKDYCGI